jgi:hypothetical protein
MTRVAEGESPTPMLQPILRFILSLSLTEWEEGERSGWKEGEREVLLTIKK